MKASCEGLRERDLPGLQGLYETEYGLTDPVEMGQGLGQGSLLSPVRAKLILAVVQGAIQRLCPGCESTIDGRRITQCWYMLMMDACWPRIYRHYTWRSSARGSPPKYLAYHGKWPTTASG